MSVPRFVWIIRSWSSEDSYWEHVREHKEFDIAYTKPELLVEEIERIVLKEQEDWKDLCEGTGAQVSGRQFEIEKPSLDQLKNRAFFKFLTVLEITSDFMQSWYIERLKIADN